MKIKQEMLGLVGFDCLKIFCIIGDLPYERTQEQEMHVDLRVEIDFSQVVESDALEDTTDYIALAQTCQHVAKDGKYQMVEKYAAEVLRTVLANFEVKSVWIRIKKPGSIEGAECAVIELRSDKRMDVG